MNPTIQYVLSVLHQEKIKNLSRGFDTHRGPVSMGKEKENKYRGIDRNVGKQAGKNDKEDDEGGAP